MIPAPYALMIRTAFGVAFLVAVFLFGWHFGGLSARGDVAKLVQKHAQEAQEASEKLRRAEHEQASAFNAIAKKYEKEKADEIEAIKARVLADVRSGRVRVRICPQTVPGSPDPSTGPGEPDAATDSGAGIAAAALGIGAKCDAQVKALQTLLTEERKDAEL